MYNIGSGDVNLLLSKNKNTKTYHGFIEKFFGIKQVEYNAYYSPIEHLRYGQMMEDAYIKEYGGDWYTQVKSVGEMDVLVSTLDLAQIENGKITDFEEIKSINYNEFLDITPDYDIRKRKRNIYNQVQQQLYTTHLLSCNVTFLCVYDYERLIDIQDNDIKKIIVERDEEVIAEIKRQAAPFQLFKNLALGKVDE